MTDKPYQSVNTGSPFRQEAGKRLADAKKTHDCRESQSPEQILPELQLHQLELEMQNESLKLALQSLAQSRDHYLELFDFAPIGYLILTRDNLISAANHTAALLLGVERDQLLGTYFPNWVAEDSRDFWHHHVLHLQQSGGNQCCELEMRRSDNSTFYAKLHALLFTGCTNKSALIHARAGLMHDENKRPYPLLGINFYITDHKQTRELSERRDKMEQAFRISLATQTIAAIAHELNQPLAAVVSYADVALQLYHSDNPNPQKISHVLEKCVAQAQRAGQVIRQLFNQLQQTEAGNAPTNINLVVCQAVDFVKQDKALGGFKLELALADDLPPVSVNELQIQKVLVNLLRNGLEAMQEQGAQAEILRVTTGRYAGDPNMVLVTVCDSGKGFAETDALKTLFQPFYSTKPSGLGMGLFISRALVQTHGGSMWAERNVGNGLSLHFTLPFAT